MTAPDVRTAAQAEADASIHVPVWFPAHGIRADLATLARQHFVEGAVWGAALVTPTREQIAEALWCFPINAITLSDLRERAATGNGDYEETLDYLMQQADAVLALMKGLSGDGH